jgi:hydrogenase expression/formation protein HypE
VHRRRDPAGTEEAARVPGVRHALHAGAAARRAHGLHRGRVRRVLPLRPGRRYEPSCPLPIADYPTVVLAHGGGGRLSKQLIDTLFLGAYGNDILAALHDGAVLDVPAGRIAFSTDSYVIDPPFFPGGNIGSLAVHGTINDLAMCGARPIALSAGYILEEGFPMETCGASHWHAGCRRRRRRAHRHRRHEGVDRGKGDGVFINTTGIGLIPDGVHIAPARVRPGDVVIVSGDRHPRHRHHVRARRPRVRDGPRERQRRAAHGSWRTSSTRRATPSTRSAIRPAAAWPARSTRSPPAQRTGIRIDEAAIPVLEEVRGACEILGLDPLYVANEGKLIAIVAPAAADASSPACAPTRSAAPPPSSAAPRRTTRAASSSAAASAAPRRRHALGRAAAPHLLSRCERRVGPGPPRISRGLAADSRLSTQHLPAHAVVRNCRRRRHHPV